MTRCQQPVNTLASTIAASFMTRSAVNNRASQGDDSEGTPPYPLHPPTSNSLHLLPLDTKHCVSFQVLNFCARDELCVWLLGKLNFKRDSFEREDFLNAGFQLQAKRYIKLLGSELKISLSVWL